MGAAEGRPVSGLAGAVAACGQVGGGDEVAAGSGLGGFAAQARLAWAC